MDAIAPLLAATINAGTPLLLAALGLLINEKSGVINLGSGRGTSVMDVIAAVRQVTGRAVPTVIGPRRPGDPPVLVSDCARARAMLGWHPRHSDIATVIGSAWDWYRAHPEGYTEPGTR